MSLANSPFSFLLIARLSWECEISFSFLLLLSRGTALLIPIPGGRLPTFLLGKGLARCKANVPPGKAASPASRRSQNKKNQHQCSANAMSRSICYCKAMLKTGQSIGHVQPRPCERRKNRGVNIHELNVLARIVTTTLRSPRESAYSRISTAARLDSGTSP